MRKAPKSLWLLAACAALLSGCATYGYDDRYAYNDGYYDRTYYERPYAYYDYGPRYYYAPRYYAEPSVGFSFGFSRHWRRH